MKRILSFAVALAATATAMAQNIAVVSPNNTTKIYQTLDEAITNAASGSVIYIPGGGFQLTDNAKIDKQLTIMGVSHRGDTDNADGATIISGNLNFASGSSRSAVIGVFVSGNVNITDSVANFTMRYCNVNSVQNSSSKSVGMVINQCYLRNNSYFGYCNVHIENCILHSARRINGGVISHNIITSHTYDGGYRALPFVDASTISYNYLMDPQGVHYGSGSTALNNCIGTGSWGDNPVILPDGTKWGDIFKAPKGVNIMSDYHLTDTWAKSKDPDLSELGIYGGGTGFSDKALAPIPRIVSKEVAEQTDGSGKLEIKVTVKAQ